MCLSRISLGGPIDLNVTDSRHFLIEPIKSNHVVFTSKAHKRFTIGLLLKLFPLKKEIYDGRDKHGTVDPKAR